MFRISGALYRKIVNGGLLPPAAGSGQSGHHLPQSGGQALWGRSHCSHGHCLPIANFTNSVIIGFGQGFQPVCGYNYGARLYGRVRQGFWFCVQFSTVFLVLISAVELVLAPGFVELFRKGDPQVVEIGARALRLQCLTFPFFGWLIISNMMMQTMGKAVRASILGIARQGIFLIPVVLLLPQWIGIWGIQLAQPIADIVSCLLAVPLQLQLLRQMRQEEQLSTSP